MVVPFSFKLFALLLVSLSLQRYGTFIVNSSAQHKEKRWEMVDIDLTSLKATLMTLVDDGAFHEVLSSLKDIEDVYGHLAVDHKMPSLFSILGVAYAGLLEHNKTIEAFQNAVKYYPEETRAWINLGETYQMALDIPKAIDAFYAACKLGDDSSLIRVLSAKAWATSWSGFDELTSKVEKMVHQCELNRHRCPLDSTMGLDYIDLSGSMINFLHTRIPHAQPSQYTIPLDMQEIMQPRTKGRLKVGIISSDFGVHPVSQLVRGLVEYIDRTTIELFCFAITTESSWWGDNISQNCEHAITLDKLETFEAASKIASMKIEVLIDLNGLTKNSGLPFMSHRPAPVQISYLGLPTTTGASFMDYYIGDYVSLPPEYSNQFVEKVALLHPSYIVNDYAALQGDIVSQYAGKQRAHRSVLETDFDTSNVTMLFGTLSNAPKMDPSVFTVWMNILRRFSGSKMTFMNYRHTAFHSIPNLRTHAEGLGIRRDRLVTTPAVDWIDHIYRKTSIDMFLDTVAKNGHTTGLDGIWAGVPTVSLGGGSSMPKRAAESIASALGSEIGISYSLKEYEDIVFKYAKRVRDDEALPPGAIREICEGIFAESTDDEALEYCHEAAMLQRELFSGQERLDMWRTYVGKKRTTSALFNTRKFAKSFTSLLQAIWEVSRISYLNTLRAPRHQQEQPLKYHVFASNLPESVLPREMITQTIVKDKERFLLEEKSGYSQDVLMEKLRGHTPRIAALHPSNYSRLPGGLFDGKPVMLNIGGIHGIHDWINVNSQMLSIGGKFEAAENTITRNMYDLQGFPDDSVSVVYSSHTLEHTSIGDHTTEATLQEWRRVLKPNGLVLIAVPDLRTILSLYIDDSKLTSLNDRYMLTMMIYGAQSDSYDFHMIGFDFDILKSFLENNGFCHIERRGPFNIFHDSSDIVFLGYRISLNVMARKCVTESDRFKSAQIDFTGIDPYDPSLTF